MNIVIIGTGNVAHVFGDLLVRAGHTILQVYGRRKSMAGMLAAKLKAASCDSWDKLTPDADLYLLALSDQALQELPALYLGSKFVVHTAGSVPAGVLEPLSPNYGVVYPLQSLHKRMPVLTHIPLLIYGSNPQTEHKLMELARDISSDAGLATDQQRLKYHVAAVFVNNFTNHLYAVAESLCKQEGISFNRLFPLIAETVERLKTASPAAMMTGPAIRDDQVTIQKHLALLEQDPLIQNLYAYLSKSIRFLHSSTLS